MGVQNSGVDSWVISGYVCVILGFCWGDILSGIGVFRHFVWGSGLVGREKGWFEFGFCRGLLSLEMLLG